MLEKRFAVNEVVMFFFFRVACLRDSENLYLTHWLLENAQKTAFWSH